jgi:ubiquinone/menaquinone biosynthesis C-methylase UbiE
MTMRGRTLTVAETRRVYDRIGRVQDLQAVYEHRATRELLAHADFEHAHAVFELGYGTGAFAARLLERYLPADSRYVGTDLSPRMAALARRRLEHEQARAELHLGDGSLHLPFEDGTFDRFVANYVLDLLGPEDTGLVLREAHRLLGPAGLLCLASLTTGATAPAWLVTRVWRGLWSLRPALVGGCRPIVLVDLLDEDVWELRHRAVVTSLGVSSEVVVAASRVRARGVEPPRSSRSSGT